MMRWEEWNRVARDETRWRGHEERGLRKAEYIQDYRLRLWFEDSDNQTIYELDFEPLLLHDEPGEVFLPLRNQGLFRQAKGDYTLSWPNPASGEFDDQSIDIAPECIRFFAERYGVRVKDGARLAVVPV